MLNRQPRAGAEAGTVLLVDDDDSVRTLIRILLTDRGYRVLEAHDAEEAFDAAARYAEPIDLLITDVVMPGMRGPELAKHMCASYANLKVLFISGFGYDASISRPHGLNNGNNGASEPPELLQKPFSLGDMARRVDALMAL